MTRPDIAEMRALVEAMSPGPWRECQAQPNAGCACGLVWSIPADLIVASVKPPGCDGGAAFNSADAVGIVALRNSAAALLSRLEAAEGRVAALEAEAAETDKVLADTLAKWEEMERCAYNICAHCKEPFERGEAMSLHAQECPRNPVAMLNATLREALTEACDVAMRAIEANEILPSTNSEAIARLRALAGGAAARTTETPGGKP